MSGSVGALRTLTLFLRGRANRTLARVLNARAPAPVPADLNAVVRTAATPLELARVVEGRASAERQTALATFLTARGLRFLRHRFAGFEGSGENFALDVGDGDRTVVFVAHHDAVPGSPGANDNAAAVGILLHLAARLVTRPPRRIRVRLLFTAAEELGYLGARAWVREMSLAGVMGVLSLELCGVGDSLAVWDAETETPFLCRVSAALEGAGLRRDEGYHVVGRVPVFGSDHRAFARVGVPAYGLTVVPLREAEALRRFVLNPARSALRPLVRRPRPFDTYHTARDGFTALEPAALELTARALEAIVAELG